MSVSRHPPSGPRAVKTRIGRMNSLVVAAVVTLTLVTYSHAEFTIHELMNKRFPHRISGDIYLDPCKAGIIQYNYKLFAQTCALSELYV